MKTYAFIIRLQRAESNDPRFVSIIYGGPDTRYGAIPFTGTLDQAITECQRLSALETRGHAASISMADRNERKPAGFDAKTKRPIYGGDLTPKLSPRAA